MSSVNIQELIDRAIEAFKQLPPEAQAAMMEEQRQSWARGEAELARLDREEGVTRMIQTSQKSKEVPQLAREIASWLSFGYPPIGKDLEFHLTALGIDIPAWLQKLITDFYDHVPPTETRAVMVHRAFTE